MAVAARTSSARFRERVRGGRPRFKATTLFDLKPLPAAPEPTLAETVQLAWACLSSQGYVPCPVCDGLMDADGCNSCGSRLE